MKHILNNSGPNIELNALFIQPTRWCALNCDGCYVKEHAGGEDGYHTSSQTMVDLFKQFYLGPHWANQITISMDDIPLDFASSGRRSHMEYIYGLVMRTISTDRDKDKPEVHLTFNSPRTLDHYATCAFGTGLPKDLVSHFNMISISHIKDDQLEYVKNLAQYTHINYNYLIPGNVTSLNIDKYVDHLTKVGKVVHSIYLVIFKTPVGRTRNQLHHLSDVSRMTNDILFINTVMERLPKSVSRRIIIDGCLQDTRNFQRTGFGCSSNVSRFQVWPDGTVSGCPYAFEGHGKQARNVDDILDNIRAERRRYDFRERCHLPKTLNVIER